MKRVITGLLVLIFAGTAFSQVSMFRAGSTTNVSDRVHFLDAISWFAPADSGAVLDTLDGRWETFKFADADTMYVLRTFYVPYYYSGIDTVEIMGYSTSSTGNVRGHFQLGIITDGSDPGSAFIGLGGFTHVLGAADKRDIHYITAGGTLTLFDTYFSLYAGKQIALVFRRLGGHAADTLTSDEYHILYVRIVYTEES